MKTKQEIKEWILENCVDKNGDLDLSNLDFTDFKGDINISGMLVKRNLYQDYQEVGWNLYQSHQKASRLFQHSQKVEGLFTTQLLKEDEEYKKYSNIFNEIVNNKRDRKYIRMQVLNNRIKKERK
ncbi:MAG: hypothetical protein RR662_05275 [Clostridia bacterium]